MANGRWIDMEEYSTAHFYQSGQDEATAVCGFYGPNRREADEESGERKCNACQEAVDIANMTEPEFLAYVLL